MYLLPKRIFSSSWNSSLSWHHHQFKLYGHTPCSKIHHYHWYCWYSAHFLCYDTLLPRYWTSRSKQNFTSKLVTRQGSHLTLKKASGLWNLAKQWHLKMVAFFFCPRRWVARWWEWHSSLVAKLLTHNQPTRVPPGAALCNKQGKCTSPQISGTQVKLQNSKIRK